VASPFAWVKAANSLWQTYWVSHKICWCTLVRYFPTSQT